MENSEKILKNLSKNISFQLKQIFGYPFVDFRISHVGETFEELINEETDEVLPSFKLLFDTFVSKWSKQFENQNVNETAIKGRVARMWASLAREWYAYYRIKEKFKEKNIPAQVTRNDSLDTFKGIDVYIENKKSPDKSIKLDILQETQRAKQFRAIKDDHRVKDREVPGIKIKILLGSGNKNTLNVPDFDGNDWYLIADSEIENIIQKFNEINS